MRIARSLALILLAPACIEGMPDETSLDSEVLGGTNAPAGKWPDVAAVNFSGQQGCTGTLIAPTVVITAGHCNEPPNNPNSVLIGTSSLARASEGETINVSKRIVYPNSQTSGADLMVLVLASPSKFEPRQIATGWARFAIKNGAPVALVGFGAIDRDGNQFKNELQEATTTITDADCTTSAGCVAQIKPGGELGAGGMGIDTCGGDSGGPLYVMTDYGIFLAGATSRGYDDNQFYCSEGGIYVRPDKFVDWMDEATGVKVARGPEPTAVAINTIRGHAGETTIVHNDPKVTEHTFTIKTAPAYGKAAVRDDGRVRVCPDAGLAGDDVMVVTVADKTDPARAMDVRVPITIMDGEPGEDCDENNFGGDDGGGCCDSGRNAGGSLPLALGVLAVIARRRRRSR